MGLKWGYQIIVKKKNGDCLVSVIEGAGSIGFGGITHGMDGSDETAGDLVEVWVIGLEPVGCLSAEEALEMIKKALEVRK